MKAIHPRLSEGDNPDGESMWCVMGTKNIQEVGHWTKVFFTTPTQSISIFKTTFQQDSKHIAALSENVHIKGHRVRLEWNGKK